MKTGQFILFAGGPRWRVVAHRDSILTATDLGPDRAAGLQKLSEVLTASEYDGTPILIALAAARCMSSTMWTDDLPRNDFKARLYRLESQLPMDAESVVADFGPTGRIDGRDCALAVCSDRAWLAELIDDLEKRQIAVGPIVPAALLAAQGQYTTRPPDELLLIAEPDARDASLNLLELRAGRPLAWTNLPSTLQQVHMHLEWHSLQTQPPQRIELLGVDKKLSAEIGAVNGWQLHTVIGDPTDRAVAAGVDVLLARRKPLIDLRRGPLAVVDRWRLQRPAINAAMAAAAVLLLALTIAFSFRTWRYDRVAAAEQAREEVVFRQAYPGWAVPGNIRAVVESEYRKFSPADGSLSNTSAMTTLVTALSHIPNSGAVSIQRMTFTPKRFDLSGRLKTYEAAEQLAQSLRGHGWEIAPPEAQRQPDNEWTFSVHGTVYDTRRDMGHDIGRETGRAR